MDSWEEWRPSRRELIAEGIATVVVTAVTTASSVVTDFPLWVVILVGLATVNLILGVIAFVTLFQGPKGYERQPADKLIGDTIDGWLKKQLYGRQPMGADPGYLAALTTQDKNAQYRVGQPSDRPVVEISCALTWTEPATADPERWNNLIHDMSMEMARFGVFSDYLRPPAATLPAGGLVLWMDIPVKGISEAKFLDQFALVRRAAAFALLRWTREFTSGFGHLPPAASRTTPRTPGRR